MDVNRNYMVLLFFCLLCMAGCSASYSVEKAFDSVSATCDGISTSYDGLSASFDSSVSLSTSSEGSPDMAKLRYQNDVEALVVIHLERQDADRAWFQFDLSYLARTHGILDWHILPSTFIAVGKGLKRAGMQQDEKTLKRFFDEKTLRENRDLIFQGYNVI